eukprot:6184036-Pleurochrysis_carterae.AAC.1
MGLPEELHAGQSICECVLRSHIRAMSATRVRACMYACTSATARRACARASAVSPISISISPSKMEAAALDGDRRSASWAATRACCGCSARRRATARFKCASNCAGASWTAVRK